MLTNISAAWYYNSVGNSGVILLVVVEVGRVWLGGVQVLGVGVSRVHGR